MPDDLATCTKCGAQVPTSNIPSERQPCPDCGGHGRKFYPDIHVAAEAALYEQYRLRRKDNSRPSKDKVRLEVISGHDLHRDTGNWNLKDRVIDRDNDRYFEHVIDPRTGETIHKCDESLKDHFGHGYAKSKPEENDT